MPKRISIVTKLMLLVGLLLGGTILGLIWYQYNTAASELEQKFGLALRHVALTGALGIDPVAHARIQKAGDDRKPEFTAIKNYLRRVMAANNLTPETVYTFRVAGDNKITFAVMLHDRPFVGSRYNIPPVNLHLFMRVLQGEAVHTAVYTDDHGTWISGLAPIVSPGGAVTGILEVDFHVKKYIDALDQQVRSILFIGVCVLAVALVLMFIIALKITRPIKTLRGAAIRIIEGDYDVKVTIDTRDEIGELEKAFNRMVKSLSERFLMLKYLSPHTQRMIEKQIHQEVEAEGELKDVTIFFSDVRGFTSFSENRAPHDIIATLNQLLEKQADIIVRHNGEIDKFVGDEIVAVFNGEARHENAIRAALEIRAYLASRPTELQVGIGIAAGEVIFGNIGSRDRRDFTMIGSNVNLAARICSVAAPGQILISSHLMHKIGEISDLANELLLTPKEAISLKGFSQPVPLFCVQPKAASA